MHCQRSRNPAMMSVPPKEPFGRPTSGETCGQAALPLAEFDEARSRLAHMQSAEGLNIEGHRHISQMIAQLCVESAQRRNDVATIERRPQRRALHLRPQAAAAALDHAPIAYHAARTTRRPINTSSDQRLAISLYDRRRDRRDFLIAKMLQRSFRPVFYRFQATPDDVQHLALSCFDGQIQKTN